MAPLISRRVPAIRRRDEILLKESSRLEVECAVAEVRPRQSSSLERIKRKHKERGEISVTKERAGKRKENVVFSVCPSGSKERGLSIVSHGAPGSPRLLKDVNDAEEAELRRLEGRVADMPVPGRRWDGRFWR